MRRFLNPIALALLVCASAAAWACSDNSTPTTPSSGIDVSGRWLGDLAVLGTTARMTWTLSQSGTTVSGPVLLGLPTGTVLLNGTLSGTLSGSTLTYTIAVGPGNIPTQPSCAGQIAGTMTVTAGSTSSMTGTSAVTGSNCTPPFPGGTLTLTKQ
jgi:hypothetical protein